MRIQSRKLGSAVIARHDHLRLRTEIVDLPRALVIRPGQHVARHRHIPQAHVDAPVRGSHVDHGARIRETHAKHAAADAPALRDLDGKGFLSRVGEFGPADAGSGGCRDALRRGVRTAAAGEHENCEQPGSEQTHRHGDPRRISFCRRSLRGAAAPGKSTLHHSVVAA